MYKDFLVGKLFRIVPTKGKCTRELITANGINYVAAKKTNNGVADRCSYIDAVDKNIVSDGNCIVFVQLGDGSAGYTTYQPKPFVGMNGKIACGYIDGILNEKIGLYLMATLDKNKQLFSYSASWTGKRLRNTIMPLPVKVDSSGNPVLDSTCKYSDEGFIPDWEYMQERITELEQERITELEQYLIATGLNDYKLTDEDKEILTTKLTAGALQNSIYGNGCLKEARMFRVGDLFEKCDLKWKASRKFDKQKDLSQTLTKEFNLPLVNAKNGNNGIMYYGRKIDFSYVHDGIDIINDGAVSTGNVYPQPHDVGVLYNAYIVTLKNKEHNRLLDEYLSSSLEKAIKEKFNYSNKAGWKKVKDCKFILPIQTDINNTPIIDQNHTYHPHGYIPDWSYMENYIKAIEKVVIKDVVKYKDEVILRAKLIVLAQHKKEGMI